MVWENALKQLAMILGLLLIGWKSIARLFNQSQTVAITKLLSTLDWKPLYSRDNLATYLHLKQRI